MANTLANEAHQRSLKDFLTLYNTITEYCFDKCVSNFNERSASGVETNCVDTCTDNYVQFNQRFMFNFVDHQERRKRELEAAAVEAAKNAALAQEEQGVPELSASQQVHVQQAAELLENLSINSGAQTSYLDSSSSSVDSLSKNESLTANFPDLVEGKTPESSSVS